VIREADDRLGQMFETAGWLVVISVTQQKSPPQRAKRPGGVTGTYVGGPDMTEDSNQQQPC
jgi:hypothetical protein